MTMTDEELEYCRNHPCVKSEHCKGGFFDPPHPRIVCAEDRHTAFDIVGLPHCLDTLYKECPLKESKDE